MPALDKKVFLITGANTGIGKVTARVLAEQGAHVILACRSEDKTLPVIAEIKTAAKHDRVDSLKLDLADLASVRAAAKVFLDRGLPLHGLINNAGLAGQRGLTKDGFEMTFGTNHLGPFLFTLLLLDKLKASAPARIVNVSSQAHYSCKAIDWEAQQKPTRTRVGLEEYAVSKLANVLFTKELTRRLEGTKVTTYALHPGVVATDVWRNLPWGLRHLAKAFMKSSEDGAQTTIRCATAPELAQDSGRYYDNLKEKAAAPLAEDVALAGELWKRSVEWTGAPAESVGASAVG